MRRWFLQSALALVVALEAGLLSGCSLFKPRDPEPPLPSTFPCPTRTAADSVQAIILKSFALSSGLTCYASTLDTSFMFHPDPSDSSEEQDPTAYSNWDETVEAEVALNLASKAVFQFAVFDSEYADPSIQTAPPVTETRYLAYHVLFQASGDPLPTRYQGLADITFQQGSDALWKITNWQDRRDGSSYDTWGRLRRNNRR